MLRRASPGPLPGCRPAGTAPCPEHVRARRGAARGSPPAREPPELRGLGSPRTPRADGRRRADRVPPDGVRRVGAGPRRDRRHGDRRQHGLRRPPHGGVRRLARRRPGDCGRLRQCRAGGRSGCLDRVRRRLASRVGAHRDHQHDPADQLPCHAGRARPRRRDDDRGEVRRPGRTGRGPAGTRRPSPPAPGRISSASRRRSIPSANR